MTKEEIDNYIIDWHWDEKSRKLAYELAEYLFAFLDDIEKSGASERTYKKHKDNCWFIGSFICQYGYHDEFSPSVFEYPPYHDLEFERKVSDSKSAVSSYELTCNKLEKYALKRGDLKYDK